MSEYGGPIYEVEFVIRGDAGASADDWLQEIIAAAHRIDGVQDVRTFASVQSQTGASIRTCQFVLRDEELLEALLNDFFVEVDGEVIRRFDGDVEMSGRTLREEFVPELASGRNLACLNCNTRLRGQYCGHCGQRSRSRLISIWQLTREAFGDLFELDSRLWKTILPLLIRPGQLTRDYLEGRRARYMPPFRTYLVLSVIFFVVAFFNPREDFSLFFEPEPEPTAAELEQIELDAKAAEQEQLDAALQQVKELEEAGLIEESIADRIGDENDININLGADDADDFFGNCETATVSDDDDLPSWFKERFTDERVREICVKNKARGIDSFKEALVDKIPIALIVLLPVLALVLKILYPLSRRYFVEHLLFFVHFHAFFFLVLTLLYLFARIIGALAIDGVISTLVIIAVSFYIPVYLYKAMRHVYGQGHLATIPKYLMLLVAYTTGASIILIGAMLFTLLSA